MSDSYYTTRCDATAEIKERGSRFIAYSYNVGSIDEVHTIIATLKKEHHAARHHCYAYRIGVAGAINRANDDGEPSGTAGRPILGQLLSSEISDTLIVVVRYFGGTLLGTSGLIAAYKEAAARVLDEAGRVEKVLKEWVTFKAEYSEVDKVMKIIKRKELKAAPIEYIGAECHIKIEIRESEKEELLQELNTIKDYAP